MIAISYILTCFRLVRFSFHLSKELSGHSRSQGYDTGTEAPTLADEKSERRYDSYGGGYRITGSFPGHDQGWIVSREQRHARPAAARLDDWG